MTSSFGRSGRWTCTLNSSRPAFSAAMEGGPKEPPSIPGPVDSRPTLCGTSPAQIRLPRRTLTSFHWRQGRQHLRRSHGSAPSMQSCPHGTMPSSQSGSRPLGHGDLVRSSCVRTWGEGLRDTLAMLGRPPFSSSGWTWLYMAAGAMPRQWWARWLRATLSRTYSGVLLF